MLNNSTTISNTLLNKLKKIAIILWIKQNLDMTDKSPDVISKKEIKYAS
jgi:hypothetical protein